MDDNSKKEKYVDANAVMEFFSLPRSTLELLIKRGLPVLRIGKARRFKLSDVEDWFYGQLEQRDEASRKKH